VTDRTGKPDISTLEKTGHLYFGPTPAGEDRLPRATPVPRRRPRDLLTVADMIVNVQTGTGNRIESWDRTGTPEGNAGKIRRVIGVGRLTKGR